MPCCCSGRTEGVAGSKLSSQSEAADVKGCDEQPTCTSIGWADSREGPAVLLSLERATRRDWAVRKDAGTDPCTPTVSRHGQSFRYWALRRHVVQFPRTHEEPSSHRIVLYSNPLSDWITACGASRWLLDGGLRSSSSSSSSAAHVGSGSPHSSVLQSTLAASPTSRTRTPDRNSEGASTQSLPSPPPQEQQHQASPSGPQPPQSPPQPLPYSVPTLAIGDVFLSCNTVAGLEHADDWDLSALGSRLISGPTSSRPVQPHGQHHLNRHQRASRPQPDASAQPQAQPQPQIQPQAQVQQPQAQAQVPVQPHSFTQGSPRSTVASLDPASELLLRMSSPVGGQRLMFVSKEGAELVRRALLLSRYDEIMAERKAAAEEATEDEAIEHPQNAVLTSRSATAATTSATGSSRTRDSGGVNSRATGSGSGSGALRAGGTAGDEDVGPVPPFASWFRRSNTIAADRAATHASPSSGLATNSPANPNPSLSSNSPDAPASEALLSGNGAESSSSATATAASTHDTLRLDFPSWLPHPIREAATAAARGVSGLLMHGISGSGNAAVDAAAASGGGGAVHGLTALLARGAASDALDVSAGPRPRLPAPPLTRAMQLPPLPPPSRPSPPPTVEAVDEGRQLQQHHQRHEAKGDPGVGGAGSGLGGGGAATASSSGDSSAAPWNSEELIRELKQLEEAKVIADAEALMQSGKRSTWGSGGDGVADRFLPPFSFSSYVARLPLEAALKALLSPPAAAPAAQAAGAEHAPNPGDSGWAAPVRRRFLLVPDSADEQAVMGSREIERLVADVESSDGAAATEGPPEVRPGSDGGASAGAAGGGAEGAAGSTRSSSSSNSGGGSSGASGSVPGRRNIPRPRVALNMFFSDSSHWVLDVVDELEQDEASEAVVGGSSGSSSSSNSQQPLPPEPFMRGAPSGPSEDLGGLVQLPNNPSQESPLLPGSGSSSLITTTTFSASSLTVHDSRTPSSATISTSTIPTAAAGSSGSSNDDDTATHGNGGGGGGRTPLFLLPGVTVSVRAADGTVLRLRPAFLSLQQLAAALTLARDAAVASWRWQRSAARWKVASALDVLTVHSAGFPIVRFPPVSSSSSAAAGAGGGSGAAGSGGGGNPNGDEDSDDGIPEAKELLREMGAGNRRPSSADALAAAAAAAASEPPPTGPWGVLSTLAVGVVSFSAWCVASAVDVWEDFYSRTPWGLEAIGVPQHVNVRPTYLEEHVRQLAEANAPAVAAAVAAVRSRAVQRALEKRARRRQQAQAQRQEQAQQLQPASADANKGEQLLPEGGDGVAATASNQSPGASVTSAAPEPATSALTPAPSAGAADVTAAAAAGSGKDSGAAAVKRQDRSVQRHRGRAAVAAAAAAAASAAFTGLSLQTETMAGLTVLLQFAWAAARAAHIQAQREVDVVFGAYSGGGDGVDGLLRLAGGRSSRDGSASFATGAAGGGSGLTLTASQDGELGLVARLDIRPVATAPPPAATAKGAASATSPASTASANAARSTSSTPAASERTTSDVQPSPSSPPPPPPAPAAATSSSKPSGMSIRELRPPGQSGLRYEVLQGSTKLASQVTRPHKFEVGFHLNMRKLLGDLPEDAPDQLLKLQQPAGGNVMLPAAAAAAGGGGGGGGSRHTGGSPGPGPALGPEAHGLLLIGDLGLEEFDGMGGMRPPALGFADLGRLLPPPGRPGLQTGLAAGTLGSAGEHVSGGCNGRFGDDSSEDEEDGNGTEGVWAGSAGGGGGGRSAGGGGVGGGVRPRGWAAGGRGVWGRWSR